MAQRERPNLAPHAAPDGTVTILFTDIEGYTAMTERLGDLRAQEVLRAHNAIIREQVTAHGGFEVKSQGDGFMVAFSSARRAILCAIAMQQAIAGYGARHPEEPIQVRIGLHTGEVIKEAEDFFGKNVILAARIASVARGGEILVSAVLKELSESAGDIPFGDSRPVEMKGISGVRTVYEVQWGAHPPASRSGARRTPGTSSAARASTGRSASTASCAASATPRVSTTSRSSCVIPASSSRRACSWPRVPAAGSRAR